MGFLRRWAQRHKEVPWVLGTVVLKNLGRISRYHRSRID
jgi:hypothetical protein